MQRAVLDTNVLVSSLVSEYGVPSQLHQAWRRGDFTLITSVYILMELKRIARTKLDVTDVQLSPVLESIRQLAEVIEPVLVTHTGVDEQDLPILGTAVGGRADFIVTGDKKLLALGRFDNMAIVTPRDFLNLFQ